MEDWPATGEYAKCLEPSLNYTNNVCLRLAVKQGWDSNGGLGRCTWASRCDRGPHPEALKLNVRGFGLKRWGAATQCTSVVCVRCKGARIVQACLKPATRRSWLSHPTKSFRLRCRHTCCWCTPALGFAGECIAASRGLLSRLVFCLIFHLIDGL